MKFGIAADWSAENVLPYAQELAGKFISWEIATSRMWIVVGVVAAIVGLVLIVADIKTQFAEGMCAIVGVFIVLTAAGVICAQVYDIITCVNFPELEILEYIKTHLNSR